jgi:hypothetical protein
MTLAALPDVLERDLVVVAGHVFAEDRRQPERAVVGRVLVAARAEKAEVYKPYGRRKHALPGQFASAQVPLGRRADAGEGAAEFKHPVELLPVLLVAPPVVVPVLATPGDVGPDSLDVAVLTRADPDVFPRGRDDQRLDAGDGDGVGEGLALHREVAETAPAAPTADARRAQVAPRERGVGRLNSVGCPGRAGCLGRVGRLSYTARHRGPPGRRVPRSARRQ